MSEGALPGEPAGSEVTCARCDRVVTAGTFCGACRAILTQTTPGGARPWGHYPAWPGERVLLPAVVSTLFPHLPQQHAARFRAALLATAALLLALGVARWTGPAIALAAAAVPLLYLLYMREVEVYGDEPPLVLGATFV